MTTISIIGTGNMARGIATRALAGGYPVQLLGRTGEESEALAGELDGDLVSTGATGDALDGDVVVLAVWYPASTDLLSQYGDALSGKVVVDVTNPVDAETFDGLMTPPGTSAAEEAAKVVPGARVVKAFNTTFAGTLVAGEVAGQQLDVLVAGDDDDAKDQVNQLIEAGGLRPVDVGPLRRARELEALGFLHMALQPAFANDYMTAVKILH